MIYSKDNMIYSIENRYLKVSLSAIGGSICSIYDKEHNAEVMWQGDEKSWRGTDICIFPFVARLKGGYYTVDGVRYEMPRHGLCRNALLEVAEHSAESITLSLTYTDATLKVYPYKYKYSVRYTLSENTLSVSYIVKNLDDKVIYYGIGGHPAFICDSVECERCTDISANRLVFDRAVDLTEVICDKSHCHPIGERYYGNYTAIPLSKDLFVDDTVILKNNFGAITLMRNSGKSVRVQSNAQYMALWTHGKYGGYICIEPWWSLPDEYNPPRELSKKYTINSLNVGEEKEYNYIIIME